jgi:hypothetical protein
MGPVAGRTARTSRRVWAEGTTLLRGSTAGRTRHVSGLDLNWNCDSPSCTAAYPAAPYFFLAHCAFPPHLLGLAIPSLFPSPSIPPLRPSLPLRSSLPPRPLADSSASYNYASPGYSSTTGHFTQLVWKATSQIGCAAVTCPDGSIFTGYGQNSLYLVCEYYVPGNWVDPSNSANTAKYFTQNVGPYQA